MGSLDFLLGIKKLKKEIKNSYTKKISAPIYVPSETEPLIESLFDYKKTKKMIREIDNSKLSKKEKYFLTLAAMRHIVFDYSKIADYYAHADKEMQDLMEKSALIIIDFDKAIENGYVRLSDEIAQHYLEDYPDGEK